MSSIEMEHLDGIPWHEAPLPRRLHLCRAQTIGYVNYFDVIERCACGAIRRGGKGFWLEKNERRKDEAPAGHRDVSLLVSSVICLALGSVNMVGAVVAPTSLRLLLALTGAGLFIIAAAAIWVWRWRYESPRD